MTHYMGIDPGKDGGLALIDDSGEIHSYTIMFSTLHETYTYLKDWQGHVKHIMLEHAQAMPKNGAVSMFNYGLGFGQLLGLITALEIPHTLVRPTAWNKVMCQGIDKKLEPKTRTLIAAQRLFPSERFLKSGRAKKPHSGIYEACLIAEYCRRKIK